MALISAETMQKTLAYCYQKALQGGAGLSSADDLAAEYAGKHPDAEQAAKALIANHSAKCAASGFVTGLGGMITLPVSIPVNIMSTYYMHLRMIAAIARLGGYDPHDDSVQTFAYLCLVGDSSAEILREAGIKISQKICINLLKKLPGALLIRINKAVGFRLITKFGTTGIINLVKAVPLAGGAVGGSVDYIAARKIGAEAMRLFLTAKTELPAQTGTDIIYL